MIQTLYSCDECGTQIDSTKVIESIFLAGTGRVLIDSVDNNQQSAVLCPKHYPIKSSWNDHDPSTWQPNNCRRVKFYWPGYMSEQSTESDEVEQPAEMFDDDADAAQADDMEVEHNFEENWADIITPNGELDMPALKRELYDFTRVMHEVSRVYDAATGGLISKPNTLADNVIAAIDDHYGELGQEYIEESGLIRTALPRITIEIQGLKLHNPQELKEQLASAVVLAIMDDSEPDDSAYSES